jgi:hypothetical protein
VKAFRSGVEITAESGDEQARFHLRPILPSGSKMYRTRKRVNPNCEYMPEARASESELDSRAMNTEMPKVFGDVAAALAKPPVIRSRPSQSFARAGNDAMVASEKPI